MHFQFGLNLKYTSILYQDFVGLKLYTTLCNERMAVLH